MPQSIGSVLLVGSVPPDSAEEVCKTCVTGSGTHLKMFPDGQVGARKRGIRCQASLSFGW